MSGILSCNSHPELANAISVKTGIPIIKYNELDKLYLSKNVDKPKKRTKRR